MQDVDHPVDHGRREARIRPDEHRPVHDGVRAFESSDDTESTRSIKGELYERWLSHEVAAEQATVPDAMAVKVA